MNSIHIFIISWKGQHKNAALIANKLLAVTKNVCIVYSDPNPDFSFNVPCQLIRRPDKLFWGDKFKSCLDACGDGPMLIIHADCEYSDWVELIKRCHDVVTKLPFIGVWAPEIDWVPWIVERQVIAHIDSNIVAVGRTDGIIFYLSSQVIARMRRANYDENLYGRGIEVMFVMAAYSRGLIAVIDRSIKVVHPKGSGYPIEDANVQFQKFMEQLEIPERIQRILINTSRISKSGEP